VSRPLLLDLFCCAGGAAMGYHRAGFDVVGVDIEPQPRYPFDFVQADAMAYPLDGFDAIHASPPCQDHSTTSGLNGPRHGTGWMLAATIARFEAQPRPWAVENVKTAPLANATDLFGWHGVELCGCMFDDLRGLLYEGRRFQTSFPVVQLGHRKHVWPQTKMGRPPQAYECMQITGHFSGVDEGRRRMQAEWMTTDELAQAVPPAYTEYIGAQLMEHLSVAA
jgi:DNA (cytosine-5)-methyltransferase 1